ncbi:MAG: 50S ribosomal protein L25/general stress protein Ctc [Gammaproteobacteria bacterium]|nr:50S ribosomal protein L25/general stress protein Ctc [Gammaproteobacteria bacterium]
MSTDHTIKATGRKDEGKGASRRLRHAGQIPAIVYGGHADPVSIQLEHEKTWLVSQNEWFYSSILSLDLGGNVERVLLRDMQRHPYKQQIMHLDFQRVSENEAIRVAVPLHFLNEDASPAGKAADVVISHELTELEVSCLPRNLPEFIEVDLGRMQVGDTIHFSDIKFPDGVEPTLKVDDEHNPTVVAARYVREEVEEVLAVEGEEGAEVPAIQQDEDADASAAEGEGEDK